MPGRRSAAREPPPPGPDAAAIDALYGLEPVFEPGADGLAGSSSAAAETFVTVECPYCWESYATPVDLSGGTFAYVEDCQVCCQPIEISLEVDTLGGLTGVRFTRLD